ncbi:LuxR C-terminal-related transcriptional regulator [Ktedonospora formicarum]|uniref:HTH luxR-type domain-containing protein n=1 Tax=Ktedonospora formicarum TaxID=2778364 RepID=A0A8J3MVF7_9CHLR|nr:LuxR C-terminal-related transcriptional regulator [Ktedonospora formicarum]GHO49285.1 hypothetical protein KSX_74480 [Ktedonospora formicarum]
MSSDALSLPQVMLPKLHLPRLRTSIVEREALLACLDTTTERKLTLISAPAGYGKTTIASAWAASRNARQEHPVVAWMALDEGDNDPVRFWRYFILACQVIYPGVGQAALDLLQSSHQTQPDRLPGIMLTTLLNDLHGHSKVGTLILEDYHLIETPQLHNDLTSILDLPNSGLRLVLLTRSDPPFPLARLRASDELFELRVPDLRFTLEETSLFLERTLAHSLPLEVIQKLAERTEGWPVGVQLASLALRGHERTPEQFLSTFTGSHRHILEYLVQETLRKQSESLQTFLLQTSLLDRLTAPLCDAVSGRGDSAGVLDDLERANLFLQPLDDEQVWYRYHALFVEAMRHEAHKRLGDAEVYSCLSRASAWYEGENRLPEAIEVAMQAQDFPRMAALIARLVEPMGNYLEHQTLWRWFKVLPIETLHTQPGLGFLYATALLFTQDRHAPATRIRIETPLSIAEHHWHAEGNLARLAQIQSFRALVALWQEDYAESFRLARESLLHLPAHEVQWRGMSLLNVSMEELWLGRLDAAWNACTEARQLLASCEAISPMLAAIAAQAQINLLRGNLHQANMFYLQILQEVEKESAEEYWLDDKGEALLGLAHLSYEWNLLDQAEHEARKALTLGEQRKKEGLQVRALLLLACVTRQEEYMHAASALLARVRRPHLRRELLLEQAIIALTCDDQSTAQRWSTSRANDERALSYILDEREALTQARLLLAQKQTSEALSLLNTSLHHAREQGHTQRELEALILLALAHTMGTHQQEVAQRLLIQALEKAQPENYQRLFLDQGEPMRILLSATIRDVQQREHNYDRAMHPHIVAYARVLIQAFPEPETTPTNAALLSPQELRVLRLLAAGRSRPDIASELVVSINTVKTQVRSIYSKLNVSSRKDAYDAAQRLGLL